MTEVQTTKAGFPLVPLALLGTIVLWVANAAGWIHVAWWVIVLPIAIALAWVILWLVFLSGVAALIVGAVLLDSRKKKGNVSGYVTPSRMRNRRMEK